MSPTLEDGEWVWLWKWPRWSAGFPGYGEVVALYTPPDTPYSTESGLFGAQRRTEYVKRVVGRPGDTLELREGTLYRNGRAVLERYISSDPAAFSSAPVTLGENEFWVLGDNRRLGESIDSRFFGPVLRADVQGEVAFVLWPPSNWGGVR